MPKKKPAYFNIEQKPPSSNAPTVQMPNSISPFGEQEAQQQYLGLLSEGVSGTKKPKRSPEEIAEDQFNKAVKDALELVEQNITRKIVQAVLITRVRDAINAKYHNKLAPADIDKFASDAVRQVAYTANGIKTLPPSLKNVIPLPQVPASEKAQNYTLEPTDLPEPDEDL